MGLFDRLKKDDSFVGWADSAFGPDFETLVTEFQDTLIEQPFMLQPMGAVTMCRSPVLVLIDGKVHQPAAVVPTPMLARFWTEEGRDVLEGTELAPIVARAAPHFVQSDELARAALAEVHAMYVSDAAPTSPWPIDDRRLRLASLLVTDIVRKLAAGFTDSELIASYGLSRSLDHDEGAKERYASMTAQEHAWMRATLT